MNIALHDTTIYQLSDDSSKLRDLQVSGETNGGVVMLLSTTNDVLKSDHEELIFNLIKAIQHDKSNVPIYHLPQAIDVPFHQVKKETKPAYLIAFGIPPNRLHLNIEVAHNQEISLAETKVLFAPPVEQLLTDKKSKGPLWKALQAMFNLK